MTQKSRLIDAVTKLNGTSFFRMPASATHHNNKEGGLSEHSLNVAKNLRQLTDTLGLHWNNPKSPEIIGLLHDLCKIDSYVYNWDYKCWEYNDEHPKGHGDLSLEVISQLGIQLTDEERECIRWHMGSFDSQDNWSKYTDAIHRYPNVLWTHVADMMATHIDEYENPEEDVECCCICGVPLTSYGHNPWPVKEEGNCCTNCNRKYVIPARISNIRRDENEE